MRFVVQTDKNVVEVNWMWLPTFIGMSSASKADMEKHFLKRFKGKNITNAVLDEIHEAVIDYILERFKRPGLREYLEAVKYVGDKP